jgi:mannose-6-phosphate isomerase
VNSVSRLPTTPYTKVWGTPRTEPWYRNDDRQEIGEVWFEASETVPLLVKLLFTSDLLSVQVHPGDEYARLHENSRGKTEMWHILRADPGARIAAGLKESASPERLREACLSGEVESLLQWTEVHPGDTFFLPAGTIHAIGAGIVACEVQQLSDVTYRLYDYGRGRELHLDRGMDVVKPEPWDALAPCQSQGNGLHLLKSCPYFRTERLSVTGEAQCPSPPRNTLYIALEGEGTIAGLPFSPGAGFEVAADAPPFLIKSEKASFLITSEPA